MRVITAPLRTLCLSSAFCAVTLIALQPIRAEDWRTNDGKTYTGVKVVKVEDDAVTILCDDGGARIALATLPPDLQQKFHYDPAKAQAAAARYLAEQKASEQQLVAERSQEQIEQQRQEAKDQQTQVELQTEQAASAALDNIKAVATSKAVWIRGKVVSVIPPKDGGVAAYLIDIYAVDDAAQLAPTGQVALIVGIGNDYVDGDMVCTGQDLITPGDGTTTLPQYRNRIWYYAGTTQYTTVMGATATCRVYSPSLEWAVRNLSDQSK